MEKHESRLQFEEDKPKESKLTYDEDLAKQAAGKAEHSSRLQFDQEELKEEPGSHTRGKARLEQDAALADSEDVDFAGETDLLESGDFNEPGSGEAKPEEPKVKERRSKLGTGSGTGRSRQEAGHADKLSFEGEPEAEETAASQKSRKAARRRPDQRADQGAGQRGRQASGNRQTGRAGRNNTLSNSARDATAEVRREVRQSDEDENAGVEGALEGESLAEGSVYAVRDFSQMHKVSSYGYANKLTNDSDGAERGYQQRTNQNGQANANGQNNANGQANPNRQAQNGGTSAAHQAQRENIKKEYAVARGGYTSAGAGAAAGTASGSAATAGQAKEAVKDTASATEKAAEESTSMIGSAVGFMKNHAFMICCIIVIIAVVLIVSGVVTSCAATAAEASGSIASTSYLADDDDILQVEAAYCELEQALQSQIDSVESSRPGYDEYKYNVDEIGHSPFELASYLTVRFGAYKLNSEVSAELQVLFDLQYQISYSVQTETRYRTNEKTGEEEAYEYRVLTVTMKNNGLTSAINQRGLSSDEQEYYQVLMSTYGNRPDIFGDGYYNSYYVEGDSYQVPGEALTDERFARMLAEAEKYLGYPYVWGGSSPSTSFDCSGFVSWVINNCGNGWSVGRQTANGLRNLCTAIPASEAQPGDLIFFQGTYNTSGASHVGIYVGNGMMIHCGNPIKYSSINTSYWQSHFLSFGRLP